MNTGEIDINLYFDLLKAKLAEWRMLPIDRSSSFSSNVPAVDGEPKTEFPAPDPAWNEKTGDYNYVTPVMVRNWMPDLKAKYCDLDDAQLHALAETIPNQKFPAPKFMKFKS